MVVFLNGVNVVTRAGAVQDLELVIIPNLNMEENRVTVLYLNLVIPIHAQSTAVSLNGVNAA